MDKSLVPLKKKIATIADQVEGMKIDSVDSLKEAVTILSTLNKFGDAVKEKKELLTKPLNEALKNARKMFSPLEEVYEGAIEMLRSKMGEWQTKQVKMRQEAELAIAERVKEGRGNLTVETAVKKIEALDVVDKEVATVEGLVQFREKKVLKIIDVDLIPREYLVVDEKKLLDDLKNGKIVAGAELDTIQVPANYR